MKADIGTILLATDFSQGSRLALDYAVSLANTLKAKLLIVNAFELGPEASNVENVDHIPSRTRRDAEARLHAFVAGSDRAGISAESVLVEGPVQDAILRAVGEFKADLLVLGTQGIHRGLDHLLIGSNTEGLMLRSPRPMLTVGPRVLAGVDLSSPFKKVVYISNLRPASAAAAPFALAISQTLGIDIEVYQVVKAPIEGKKAAPPKGLLEEYCSRLSKLMPDVKEEWCNPEFQIGRVIAPQAVLEKSQDPSVLMIVGVPEASLLVRHLRTSYPYRLLANAACPIITVRS
jgi:nucleotide-binding universal stress UspA family protein